MSMIGWDFIRRLMGCFPRSFLNQHGEFIAHDKANAYFILHNCETELDVKCKVLEWFSRDAFKTEPFGTKRKNDEFHKFMLDGINKFLETSFTEDDMEQIYIYLGNACRHEKTIKFVCSGYDFAVLKSETKE